ncbi:hypothetical protein ACP275_10G110400 [Erythranthe tilingii]
MRIKDKKSKVLSDGNTSIIIKTIHECAEAGDLVVLQSLLSRNPSLLNQTSDDLMSHTPLHCAANFNRVEVIAYLIKWGGPGKVELEARNVYGETPLHVAAKNGCNEALKLLLQSGAYVEATTNNSMTPLHLAVGYALRSGENSTVKTLLEYNADCSAKDDEGMIPFNYLPAALQNEELIRLLKINVPNQNNGVTSFSPYLGNQNNIVDPISSYTAQLNNIMIGNGTTGYSPYLGNQNAVNPISSYTAQLNNIINGNTTTGYSSYLGNQTNNSTSQYNNIMEQIYGTAGYTSPANPNLGSSAYFNHIMEQINSTTGDLINQINGSTSTPVQQNLFNQTNYSTTGSSSTNDNNGIQGKMEEFDQELSKIVGLHELKLQLKKWAKGMLMDEKRRAMGIDLGPRKPPHMAFLGNPGTGKTTVARILGKLLKSVGVLSSDSVTEVQRSDLIAEYTGQTGPKTRKKIEEAMGGTLFVDEAYRLAPERGASDSQDFGVEALEEIMSVLEDGDIVVIFAGYTEPMKRVFSSNAGFTRRVTHFFQFDDFTCKDLAEMLMIKMSKQNKKSRLYGFKLHPSCTSAAVLAVIEKNSTEKLRNKMNGGLVDHMLNNARENLDSRLNFDSKGDELLTITLSDLEAGLKTLSQRVNVD